MDFWADPIKFLYEQLQTLLVTTWHWDPFASDIVINLLAIVGFISAVMVLDIILVWVERKIVSRFQDRIGPNRVGPWGLLQPFPDIIKLLTKEDITPVGAD